MKSITIIIFLIAFTQLNFGQQVIYKPVFIDQCSGLEKDSVSWWLIGPNGQSYGPDILRDDIVVLPDTGEYFLFSEICSFNFSIQNSGFITDTIYTARISQSTYINCATRLKFNDCNAPADGNITDYYGGNNIRMTGSFRNGKLVDTLKEFYRNGMIREIQIPENWKIQKEILYYQNGKIKMEVNYKEKFVRGYYETGVLSYTEIHKRKNNEKTTGYFCNSQIKYYEDRKQQIKYDSTGNVIQTMTRKKVRELKNILKRSHLPLYEYQCNLFDSTGTKLAVVQFSGDGYYDEKYFPDYMTHIEDFLFEKIILYKNGEVIESVDFSNTDQKSGQSAIIQKLLQIESALGK